MDEKKNLAVNGTKDALTQEEVLEYLRLVDRRVFIMDNSYGDKWRPEYAAELEEIDKKLDALRKRVDAALAARDARRALA